MLCAKTAVLIESNFSTVILFVAIWTDVCEDIILKSPSIGLTETESKIISWTILSFGVLTKVIFSEGNPFET